MFIAREIAKEFDGIIVGDEKAQATHFSGIKDTEEKSISFITDQKYFSNLPNVQASIVLCPFEAELPKSSATLIKVKHPLKVFALLEKRWLDEKNKSDQKKGIDNSAVTDSTASIGKDVYIGQYVIVEKGVHVGDGTRIMAHCFIGKDTNIGKNCIIYPNVTIREEITVGNDVIIHSGVVIGSDGFGFAFDQGIHYKVPQIGSVEIGDNVEIGANTAIDRGAVGKTKIGKGTKIDNLVQIAHNVEIGENCIICAQAGIAGSTVVGNYVTLAGQAGITGHITIGDGATAAARAGVTKNIPAKEVVSGYPAAPHKEARMLYALTKRLPEFFNRLKLLERREHEKTKND